MMTHAKSFPPHYTTDDVKRIKEIMVWGIAKGHSYVAIGRLIGGSNGNVCQVLTGKYPRSPTPILDRIWTAAGFADQAKDVEPAPVGKSFTGRQWGDRYTPDDIAEVGEIVAWAKQAGMGFAELSRASGIARTTIHHVLGGNYKTSPAHVLKALRAFMASGTRVFYGLDADAGPTTDTGRKSATLRDRIMKRLAKHSSQHPISTGDLIALIGGDEAATWACLEALINECQVMSATVIRGRVSSQVVYPMGRIPTTRPGPKESRRGPSVVITPRSVYGGNQA